MRITLVHYSCWPILGGVESVLGDHARLLADHGHTVTLAVRRGARPEPRLILKLLRAVQPGEVLEEFRALCAGQDLVIVHNVLTMPFEPAWTAALWQLAHELPAVRFISWVHDLAAANPDYTVAAGSLLHRAHPQIETVVVSELRQRQFLRLTGADSVVIPNGIDPAQILGLSPAIAALADSQRLWQRELVLLQPCRLLRRKNVELSLRVIAALQRVGHDCCLLITGPPDAHQAAAQSYAEQLHELHQQLGLGDAALFLHEQLGAIDQHDLRSLYQLADALWFPSWQEGFGLPILEAALHRLPIFCSDIEPLPQLVAGTAHLLDPAADPDQLAAWLIAVDCPPQRARKKVCADYAWSAIYEKFLAPLLAKKHIPHAHE